MNKQEKKLIKYADKACECTSREEAQKILKKYNEARTKLLVKRMISDEQFTSCLWPFYVWNRPDLRNTNNNNTLK